MDLIERLTDQVNLIDAGCPYDEGKLVEVMTEAAAELARLQEHGPTMRRGSRGDGTPEFGTMLEVLNDYRQAAEVEAGIADELRAELARLRAEVEGLRGDAQRYRWMRSIESFGEWRRVGHYAEHALDSLIDAALTNRKD